MSTATAIRPAQVPSAATGWNLVQFTNGSAGVVRWTGSGWDWGSLASAVNGLKIKSTSFLGSTIADIANNPSSVAPIGKLPGSLSTIIISALDHGILGEKGQPVLFAKNGTAIGNSGQSLSEANPANIIPTPSIPSVTSIFGVFASGSLWAGIGMTLMGAALIMFGIVKLSGGNPTQVAKRVAHV